MHNYYFLIISKENLFNAYYEFRKGKRHRAEVAFFELDLEENILEIYERLHNGEYKHGSYIQFIVRDPKPRIIHKATISDRIVHQAIYRVLNKIFDKTFINDSYSSRVGKGTHSAIKILEYFVSKKKRRKCCYGTKMDIKKFFNSIDHDLLKRQINRKIKCEKTLQLIGEIINSYHSVNGKGLPLGNVTSQLFANIYLNELDRFVKLDLKIKQYIRFCDDFIIVGENIKVTDLEAIKDFLKKRLLLKIKDDNLKIRKLKWGLDYLGVVMLPHHKIIRKKTKNRLLRKIKQSHADYLSSRITLEKFAKMKQSYLGHLSHTNSRIICQYIEGKYGK